MATSPRPEAHFSNQRLDPNYVSDPHDIDALVTPLNLARAIGRAEALDPWRGAEVHTGPDADSRGCLRACLRGVLQTYRQPVGMCRIGDDDAAVLNTELCACGISGPRVADASVMPSVVSRNTMASVYGTADRAAGLMRASADIPSASHAAAAAAKAESVGSA
jgi:choline dehydrogenase